MAHKIDGIYKHNTHCHGTPKFWPIAQTKYESYLHHFIIYSSNDTRMHVNQNNIVRLKPEIFWSTDYLKISL